MSTRLVIIRAFELEAVVVFLAVAWRVAHDTRATGRLTLLGFLFVGNLAVALVGDPIANWALTALYSDDFHLLPGIAGLGLSPAQSWAVVFAYPWCFPMLAFGGRLLARRLGGRSPASGFVAGVVVGGLVFAVFVYLLFVPAQVIVYQRTPPAVTLYPGTVLQRNLLDVLGVALYIGASSALLMPDAGRSVIERRLPANNGPRVLLACGLCLGLFLAGFAPAIGTRLLGLDTAVGFRTSPYASVPLY